MQRIAQEGGNHLPLIFNSNSLTFSEEKAQKSTPALTIGTSTAAPGIRIGGGGVKRH